MLIDSTRITDRDRDHWDALERYDRMLAADPALDRKAESAVAEVRAFLDAGEAYVSVSWGKDSVVVAHLAALAELTVRVVWVRSVLFETPECDAVRDAFLDAHPQVRYEEIAVEMRNPKRGEPGYDTRHADPHADHQDVLRETLTGRWISGLRGEESRMRRMSIAHRGLSTKNTCRPIGRWDATHVFAYLWREKLPVHPVYAMTAGGHYDRRWLRVHPLGSAPPARSAVHGRDMDSWEDAYYGDVLAAARQARAHLWR
ncbi:hypothetical protein GCM10022243_48860 [Saccharothrix violaceirubra]|uniref:Phosphoadenosine phosphosulfate reductase n=1 Tax=Saccharothrix violaceirubra TaxID=413306 RepID=A0A7W7SZD7_9PSEU|nr:phosphoadenosine phosphosulfate reductase family protein [Saccharothrix violaceirubra]MBB4963772.1 phosphoadenosine phosphosulfate reductase [Saccharothrix violaceirubra]